MLKAILFDYNGILVDDLKLHLDAYMSVARDLHYALDPDRLWRYISATPDEKRFLFGDVSDAQWRSIRELKDTYYYQMAASRDILIPGAVEVLKTLARTHVLALISNTSRSYFETCFPKDAAALFSETLFSEDMEKPKPSPEPLFHILKRLNLRTDEICYVGDAVSDVQMARAASVTMFAVATGHHSADELAHAGADRVVATLAEFVEAIQNGASGC